MCAQFVMVGSQSSIFPVDFGEKQGCVVAPFIYNLFPVATTLVCHRDLQSSDCAVIDYRLDAGLFKLRRLPAKTKTSFVVIFALQYADDTAFPRLTADRRQCSLDVMAETYFCAGRIINTTQIEILSASLFVAPTFTISGKSLETQKISPTWARISHFLLTSSMRSKDATTLLHKPLPI